MTHQRIRFAGRTAAAVFSVGLAGITAAHAELPQQIAVTAYDVGASGYAQAVAVGAAFKNNLGVTLRVIPGKNDVSRTVPLREGKADFSFNGVGTYFGQEAVDVFALPDWGPQEFRMINMALGDNCLTLFTTQDSGIEKLSDLKGKRMAWVKGSPALNHNSYSHLRFADLTLDDVTLVEVGGNNGAFDAILSNQADAFFSTTLSGNMERVFASPRGLRWVPLPHDDKAGWDRLKAVAPYFARHTCTKAAGNFKGSWEAGSYPYPVVIQYKGASADKAYAMTKAMFEQYDNYKTAAPGADGYALEKQVMEWAVPFDDGAIRYYKEVGKWTDDIQAHNDGLIARQEALVKLWNEFKAGNPPADPEAYKEAWMKYRFAGMKKAGLNPVWETF